MKTQTKQLCTHINVLSKEILSSILDKNVKKSCQICEEISVSKRGQYLVSVCLHCSNSFCVAGLEKTHMKEHFQQTKCEHMFSLALNFPGVFCQICQQWINNPLFDYSGSKDKPQYKRLCKFQSFMKQIWKQLLILLDNDNVTSGMVLGLENLGNTCFLNSAVQGLFATRRFTQHLQIIAIDKNSEKIENASKIITKEMDIYYSELLQYMEENTWHIVADPKKRNINKNKSFFYLKELKNCRLNSIFQQTYFQIKQALLFKQNSYAISQILDYLVILDNKYSKAIEEDSQQVLLLLIDVLSQGERIAIYKNDIKMKNKNQKYNNIEKLIGPQQITHIQNIFSMYLATEIICTNEDCQATSFTLDLAYNIQLSPVLQSLKKINKNQLFWKQRQIQLSPLKQIQHFWKAYTPSRQKWQQSLKQMQQYFQPEMMSKHSNYYQCQKCKNTYATKFQYILNPGDVFIITMKRFNSSKLKYKKHIPFQAEIDLQPFCIKTFPRDPQKQINASYKYSLYAVIVHQGETINQGHYYCYVKKQKFWWKCSDQNIRRATWAEIASSEAYILFYQRNCQQEKTE